MGKLWKIYFSYSTDPGHSTMKKGIEIIFFLFKLGLITVIGNIILVTFKIQWTTLTSEVTFALPNLGLKTHSQSEFLGEWLPICFI